MATLSEVAKRAGVSTATVSKVLSGTPYFTEETRQKVMAAVEELGYVPNLAGRALSSGKTHIIAVVFPHIYDSFTSDPLTLHILAGIEAEISEQEYNLLLSTPRLSADGPDEHYQRLVRSGYVDGIVALDNVPLASVLPALEPFDIPAVSIGYGQHPYNVRSDDRLGSQQIMEHVIGLGHREIAIITVDPSLHYCVDERMAGYQAAAEQAGLDFDRWPRYQGDFSINSGASCARQLLDEHPDTTAIVCLNDRMAIGAVQEAHRQGRAVPQDITIAGYDDIPMASLVEPALTTVSQRGPSLGRLAIRMLFDLFEGQTPESIVLETDLVIRQSSTSS